jgi:hypothetical protein
VGVSPTSSSPSALREFITTEGYNARHIIEAHDVPAFDAEVADC